MAIHNVLGIGEKRLYEQILPEYNKLLEHYSVWKDDEVQDVMLQRLVTQSFPSLDDIFKGCPREKPSWEE